MTKNLRRSASTFPGHESFARRRHCSYVGEEIDLVEWTRANSHKLVLKPNDDYGGHGIYIGWNSTAAEWNDAIEAALANGDYLVQERVKTAKEVFPMIMAIEGDIETWSNSWSISIRCYSTAWSARPSRVCRRTNWPT